eukprot:scaffold359191_cov18-Prasinocladus_malaysianus.AAC.1
MASDGDTSPLLLMDGRRSRKHFHIAYSLDAKLEMGPYIVAQQHLPNDDYSSLSSSLRKFARNDLFKRSENFKTLFF